MMKIGWIGTGVMGASMVGHLQKAGCDMAVFTRSKKWAQAPTLFFLRWNR